MARKKYAITATAYDKHGRKLSVGQNDYARTHPIQAELAAKAGDCTLEYYSIHLLPVGITKSLDKREIFCNNCNTKLELEWQRRHPSMFV